MDDLDVEITVNGEKRTDGGSPLNFTGIPSTYTESSTPEITESNSIEVFFSEPVTLRDIYILPGPGSDIPSNLTIILRDGNGEIFTDENGYKVATEPISFDERRFKIPGDLKFLTNFTLILVSADEPDFSIKQDFIGCVHPGTHLYLY